MTATTSRACRQRATWYDDDIRNREADENHERRASAHPSWLRDRDPLGKLGAHASNVHLWPPSLPVLCMRPHPSLRDPHGKPDGLPSAIPYLLFILLGFATALSVLPESIKGIMHWHDYPKLRKHRMFT